MAEYPTLRFLEKHGGWLAIAVGVTAFLAGIVAAALGASPWWLLAGAVIGALLFLLARSYVELIRLMTDMLLPK
jgi:amino acid transporter